MGTLKIDIRREKVPSEVVDCECSLIIAIDKDEAGKPTALRSLLVGNMTGADLLVMARAAMEHVERTMTKEFGNPGFDVVGAVQDMMNRSDLLDSLDSETATRN